MVELSAVGECGRELALEFMENGEESNYIYYFNKTEKELRGVWKKEGIDSREVFKVYEYVLEVLERRD